MASFLLASRHASELPLHSMRLGAVFHVPRSMLIHDVFDDSFPACINLSIFVLIASHKPIVLWVVCDSSIP